MCHAEASALKMMLSSQNDNKKEIDEMKKISDQIVLARNAATKATTQAKNVLRVMLGEKPHPPRNQAGSTENMFPLERKVPTAAVAGTKVKAVPKAKVKRHDPSLGERAIRRAMKNSSVL